MKMQVYIGAPLARSQNDTNDVIRVLKDLDSSLEINYWRKGSSLYNDDWLERSDIVVFLLPHSSFHCNISSLPIGIHKEYNKAVDMDKSIYFAYRRTSDGIMAIYDWQKTRNGYNDMITLLPGSSHKIATHIDSHYGEKDLNCKKEDSYKDYNIQDKRLLLLIPKG